MTKFLRDCEHAPLRLAGYPSRIAGGGNSPLAGASGMMSFRRPPLGQPLSPPRRSARTASGELENHGSERLVLEDIPSHAQKGYKFEKTFKNCEKVYLSDFIDIFTGK